MPDLVIDTGARRPVIPCDARIARLWGELTGAAQLRGRPSAPDATWIAACCLHYQLPLLTLDQAGFGDLAAYHGLVLPGEQASSPPAVRGGSRPESPR